MMVRWNEDYSTKFLKLFEAHIAKSIFNGRKKIFWELFTKELNKYIKEEKPEFVDFKEEEVLNHGIELRRIYNRVKDVPYMLCNFELYANCFRKCDSCKSKDWTLKCRRCQNTPIFSLGSDLCNSSTSRSRKRRATTRENDDALIVEHVTDRLAEFGNQRRVSFMTLAKATIYFSDYPGYGRTWLKLSTEAQILYLEECVK